jgi:hypothetical protein
MNLKEVLRVTISTVTYLPNGLFGYHNCASLRPPLVCTPEINLISNKGPGVMYTTTRGIVIIMVWLYYTLTDMIVVAPVIRNASLPYQVLEIPGLPRKLHTAEAIEVCHASS